jgi:mannose-6-phosphate isomerase-like protein (cupin superfamily)
MADYAVKRIDEMEAIVGGAFKRARAELGVESFGMQVIDMQPNEKRFPEHNHTHDEQEEVYVVLRGAGELELDGESHAIDPDTIVRIGPGVKRKIVTSDQPIRVLALGGRPGKEYEPPDWSHLGAADPFTPQAS